jgi:hypothetical protein
MNEAANRGGLCALLGMEILVELGRDARERVVELGAQAIDHGDDRDGNAGSDQAVFNGSCPRTIVQET